MTKAHRKFSGFAKSGFSAISVDKSDRNCQNSLMSTKPNNLRLVYFQSQTLFSCTLARLCGKSLRWKRITKKKL